MNDNLIKKDFSIQSYVDGNRDKLDEALVSLRFMKEIDLFLEANNISNKKLAIDLGYSESFISQLMSGVKKINVSFINKFEKNYNVKINFSIQDKREEHILSKSSMSYLTVYINNSEGKTVNHVNVVPVFEYVGITDYEEVSAKLFTKKVM